MHAYNVDCSFLLSINKIRRSFPDLFTAAINCVVGNRGCLFVAVEVMIESSINSFPKAAVGTKPMQIDSEGYAWMTLL